jgi:hypothetical protein
MSSVAASVNPLAKTHGIAPNIKKLKETAPGTVRCRIAYVPIAERRTAEVKTGRIYGVNSYDHDMLYLGSSALE